MQELKIDENKRVIQYFIKGIPNDFRGDIYFWTKLMKSIKMSKKIKIKNTINEFKIKFLRSCRKRMNFLTKKYKNTIDGTH